MHEVSLKQGDEEPKEHNNEERQASNPRNMPSVWHQDVQDWQDLDLLGHGRQNSKRLDFPGIGMSSPFILRITLSIFKCNRRVESAGRLELAVFSVMRLPFSPVKLAGLIGLRIDSTIPVFYQKLVIPYLPEVATFVSGNPTRRPMGKCRFIHSD